MIYLLSTNRPKWAEYAYRQYKRFEDYDLVVLDNTKKGIPFWKKNADFHYHLPELDNVSQMYNWFLENHPLDNIFYADDDMEYHPDLKETMEKYLNTGWDLVTNCRRYVTCDGKSEFFHQNPIGVGASWMASKSILKLSTFDESTVDGVCRYMRDLTINHQANTKRILEPMVNLQIHDDNVLLRKEQFDFNQPLIDWDNNE